ncbi:DUF475 domain-containing protein [Candidatus Peregrinibacteria bacterium]|nr:DUF475 domain-containing protein [Candidatus Peregrinibacteria bacterium]
MNWLNMVVIVLGLGLFETIASIDNAVINAEVLSTMQPKARKWFLLWGLIIAVFLVRGLLPWMIVWAVNPSLGPIGALTSTFSSDPSVKESVEKAAPILLAGGGTFLIFLFFHWLFLEEKHFGLPRVERFFLKNGIWFYATVSIVLSLIVWFTLKQNPMMAFGAVLGSTAFFITHGFKQNAEAKEKSLTDKSLSDISKLLYLEIIDATFSIDGVLGAFAFTLSVPLILLGNGLGALVVRELTVGNIERIKKYIFLKNGAMYSILFLGSFMLMNAFGIEMPEWISSVTTFSVVLFFFLKSHYHLKLQISKQP